MLTTPLDFLPALAAEVLPGCRYQFGTDEEQDNAADKVIAGQDIFFVDAEMPVRMVVGKVGALIVTYTVTILLLAISKPTDPAPLRWPRMTRMIDAGARLLMALRALDGVKAEQTNAQVLYNHFNRNADGMAYTFEIIPPDTFTYC